MASTTTRFRFTVLPSVPWYPAQGLATPPARTPKTGYPAPEPAAGVTAGRRVLPAGTGGTSSPGLGCPSGLREPERHAQQGQAQIQIARTTNPVAHIELFGGRNWSADLDVLCNGGTRSVSFFDQKSVTNSASGAFRLSPRVGDRLRISISRNVSGHRDSFTATNLRTGRSLKEIDRTSGGVTVMYPGKLSTSGGGFSTYLHAVP